ncbi:MAG: hypothetical protein WDN46_11370 [Methylocella sp.]
MISWGIAAEVVNSFATAAFRGPNPACAGDQGYGTFNPHNDLSKTGKRLSQLLSAPRNVMIAIIMIVLMAIAMIRVKPKRAADREDEGF